MLEIKVYSNEKFNFHYATEVIFDDGAFYLFKFDTKTNAIVHEKITLKAGERLAVRNI